MMKNKTLFWFGIGATVWTSCFFLWLTASTGSILVPMLMFGPALAMLLFLSIRLGGIEK